MKYWFKLCATMSCCFFLFTLISCNHKTRESASSGSTELHIDDFASDTSLLVDNAGVTFKLMNTDTTMPLSYKGIVIGETVSSYFGNSIPKSSKVDTFGEYCKYSFKSTIQVNTKEYPTFVKVYCINDTIVLLNVNVESREDNYSDKWQLHTELMELFSVKYGSTIDYLPSDYLIAFLDTIDQLSSSRVFDRYEDAWYTIFKRYTYHFSVWGIGSQSVIFTREICNFEKFWDWDEEYENPEWWSSNERVFLVYGDDVLFSKLVKGKLELDYYNLRQKTIQDSIATEQERRLDSIRSVNSRNRIMQDANQI